MESAPPTMALPEKTFGFDRTVTIENVVDTVAASRWRSVIAVLIVALACFLPGFNSIAPADRDEPSIAQATRLMVRAGDYAPSRPGGGWELLDPIGIHWLQAASVAVVGKGDASPLWVYRLPSLLGAIAAALLTWWAALAFGRPRAALLAALLVAATPLLGGEARLARPDAVLLATIVLAQGALARVWLKKGLAVDYGLAVLFWTALAFGILLKGLVAPLVIGMTVVILVLVRGSSQWLRRLAPISGLIWLAVLLLPWPIAVWMASGSAVSLAGEVARQAAAAAPPGIYAVLFYPFFGPAGIFVALAIPALLDQARRPVFVFTLAWAVPFWLLMELLPGKLPHYVLPAYPALAIIAGTAIDEGTVRIRGWISTYFSLNPLVWPWVMAVVSCILFFVAEARIPFAALPFYAVAIIAGFYSFLWFYRHKSIVGSAILSVLCALFIHVGFFGVFLPNLGALQVSGRLVAAAHEVATCDKPEFVATGFPEPSLVFIAGDAVRMVESAEAADFLAGGNCRLAFVERRRQAIFNQQAADLGMRVEVRQRVRGFDLVNMRTLDIRIFSEAQAE